jgi:feruloyl esterase
VAEAVEFFQYVVFNDPAWDFRTLRFDTAADQADAAAGDLLNVIERGQAPERIPATHSTNCTTVDRTRPLCPYPQVAKYKGNGSIDDAANFSCISTND